MNKEDNFISYKYPEENETEHWEMKLKAGGV